MKHKRAITPAENVLGIEAIFFLSLCLEHLPEPISKVKLTYKRAKGLRSCQLCKIR